MQINYLAWDEYGTTFRGFVGQTSLFIHALRFLSNFNPDLSNISVESFLGYSILLATEEIDFHGAVLLEFWKFQFKIGSKNFEFSGRNVGFQSKSVETRE